MTTATELKTLQPVVAGPADDRAPFPIGFGGHSLQVKVTGADSGGNFALGYLTAGPMSGPPLHMHTREDEWFYILKGEMTFQVGNERITAGPGTSIFAPRYVPHTWQNLTDEPVEALALVTPSNFENFLAEMTQAKGDTAALQEATKRYGNVVMGPPLSRG